MVWFKGEKRAKKTIMATAGCFFLFFPGFNIGGRTKNAAHHSGGIWEGSE